ncbi:MAG: DUF3107 family protein [Acidimicrobiia bacterium]
MRVRIGFAQVARDLDVDVEDGEELVKRFERAVNDGEHLLWFSDSDGQRYGLVVSSLAYIQLEAAGKRLGVGFGAE